MAARASRRSSSPTTARAGCCRHRAPGSFRRRWRRPTASGPRRITSRSDRGATRKPRARTTRRSCAGRRSLRARRPTEDPMATRVHGIRRLVGNTPLLAIDYRWRGHPRRVYAKFEQANLSGSIKDRMALHILDEAAREGRLQPGDTIAEATSGNTGISMAAIGRALGYHVRIFMPDWMSRERRDLIATFGARIDLIGRGEGGFLGCIARAEALAADDPRVFLPSQFSNTANPTAHETTTGPELLEQLASIGVSLDAFAAGVGTGGTVMGVGRALRRHDRRIRVHPVEPAESPTLTTGVKRGRHRIQGISDEFVPPVVRLDEL